MEGSSPLFTDAHRLAVPRRASKAARTLLAPLLLLFTTVPQGVTAQDYGDTPYVQTPVNVVETMLEIAKVGPKDYVIDLGSGDGRMVILAAKKYGASGFGVDHDQRLVKLANANAAKQGVAERAAFYTRDLYKTDIRRATVMTIYLLPEVNLMVRPRLFEQLRPGTRIVSHDYDMGAWKPDHSLTLQAPGKPVGKDPVSKVFYWVMPANVTGDWRSSVQMSGRPLEVTLAFSQTFQFAEGTARAGGDPVKLESVTLEGDRLSFKAKLATGGTEATEHAFTGRVRGNAIEGTVITSPGAKPVPWRAQRTGGRTAINPEPDPLLAVMNPGSKVQ